MGRDFQINGETLVIVRFGDHISGRIVDTEPLVGPNDDYTHEEVIVDGGGNVVGGDVEVDEPGEPSLFELGLASDGIVISPTFYHKGINVNDFGPNVPAEVMWQLAAVNIRMNLIHFDKGVLKTCLNESMCGCLLQSLSEGTLAGAGSMMGRGKPIFASGNHFISVTLLSPQLQDPWHFPTCYLTERPMEYPLGTSVINAACNWMAIPYRPAFNSGAIFSLSGQAQFPEIQSSGIMLWNRNPFNTTDENLLNAFGANPTNR